MGIFIGESTKNQAQISYGAQQMQKVYVGNNLVWQNIPPFTPIIYGAIYNFFAAIDARGLAPNGWHVSTFAELTQLITDIGANTAPAMGIRTAAPDPYWSNPGTAPTNASGLNMYPSGTRLENGSYNYINSLFQAWSSTSYDDNNARWAGIINTDCSWAGQVSVHNKRQGKSIRLVCDSTTDPGFLTDIDGNVYPTVKIGNIVWLAENYRCTKFKNGEDVALVTDATAWSLLNDAGRAYPNGNPLYV